MNLKADMWNTAKSSGISLDVFRLFSIDQIFKKKSYVPVDPNTRPSICFKTRGLAFGDWVELLKSSEKVESCLEFEKLRRVFQKLGHMFVYVITRSMLS